MMWDVANNLTPANINSAFTKTSTIHKHKTRSSAHNNFFIENSKLGKMRNSFLRLGPRIWNSIPSTTRDLPKASFKKEIKHILFDLLSEADDYLEVSQIINNIK